MISVVVAEGGVKGEFDGSADDGLFLKIGNLKKKHVAGNVSIDSVDPVLIMVVLAAILPARRLAGFKDWAK